MYEKLTTFIPKLKTSCQPGSTSVVPRDVIRGLTEEIYDFADSHPEYDLGRYGDILQKHGIDWSMKSMQTADVNGLDGQAVMALLIGAVRAEHYCTHPVLDLCQDGSIGRWLSRLQKLDGK